MLKEQAHTLEGAARATDLLLVVASVAISAALSFGQPTMATIAHRMPKIVAEYRLLFAIALAGWVVSAEYSGIYRSVRSESWRSVLRIHLTSVTLWALATLTLISVFNVNGGTRSLMVTLVPLVTLALGARWIIVHVLARYIRAKGYNLRDVIVVGETNAVGRFTKLVESEASSGYRIVRSIVTDRSTPFDCEGIEFSEAFVLVGRSNADLEPLVMKVVKQGKRVHLVPAMFETRQFRHALGAFAGIPLLTVGGYGVGAIQTIAKRAFDIVGSVTLLVVLAPLLLVVAVLVKLSSSGPVLFSQTRLGEGGRHFRIYKFRSMYQNAEEVLRSNPAIYEKYVRNNYKLPKHEDFRITPIGAILRSTSIDELPQLLNVLEGHMSLVGPRPVVPSELTMYGDCSKLFTSVKPGMTGYWQIKGRSDVADYTQRATFDLEYIRDQSLINDIQILLKTIPAVVMRRGAH